MGYGISEQGQISWVSFNEEMELIKKTICVYKAISNEFRNSFQKMSTFHFRAPFCVHIFFFFHLIAYWQKNMLTFFLQRLTFLSFSLKSKFSLPSSKHCCHRVDNEKQCNFACWAHVLAAKAFVQITISRALIWSPQNPKEHTGAKERVPGCVRVRAVIIVFPVLGGIWDSEECGEWQWQLAFVRCDRQKENCWLSPPI